MTDEQLYEAARANNVRLPDGPIDHYRLIRAQEFASRILAIISRHCDHKEEARKALVAAAYAADASLAIGS